MKKAWRSPPRRRAVQRIGTSSALPRCLRGSTLTVSASSRAQGVYISAEAKCTDQPLPSTISPCRQANAPSAKSAQKPGSSTDGSAGSLLSSNSSPSPSSVRSFHSSSDRASSAAALGSPTVLRQR